jgi:uncharacterized delta-60 repeat protein/uncharacterized repeat protein (TIGR01451 family)
MCTLYDRILQKTGGLFTVLCAALAFWAGGATDVRAQPAPPNDNLTNAAGINGSTGSIEGTNLYATMETSEPAPYGAGASIWYLWIAPITTTMDFNTRNSTDPSTGEDLNTVLGVYALKSGTNVAYTNLTVLATNEEDPSGGVTSRVDVPVAVGQIYLIQVLGSPNDPTGTNAYAQGKTDLNWSPSLVAGNFGFSTSTYFAGEFDDEIILDYEPNSIDQSLANKEGTNNIRITVTRQGGSTGKCQVTLTVTNLTYFNEFITNYTITNIYTTNFMTNASGGIGAVANFTNIYFTNIAAENLIEEYINNGEGGLVAIQRPLFFVSTVTQTNYGLPAPPVVGPLVINASPALLSGINPTNFFTNFPCAAGVVINGPTTNNTFITISVTQVVCIGPVTNTVMTPSASNNVDYVAITTNLTFNDFQMSRDVYLQINPFDVALPGPDWPDAKGNSNLFGINSLVLLSLSNPVLDSNEDLDITPPTLSTSLVMNPASAYLDILNYYDNPNNRIGGNLTTNLDYVTINLERATFRCNRIPNGSNPTIGTNAFLYAVLAGNPADGASYTVHYTIDCEGIAGGGVGTPVNAFNWNKFPTVAGSDYAQPNFFGVTNDADFGVPVNAPADPSTENVGRNTTWPGGVPYIGSFTIGPFPPGVIFGEIAIPILTNGAVEFDVDMDVELFETLGDASANSTQMVPGFIGDVSSANLTINFTGEPGGSYDTSFNIDNSTTSIPPNNTQPGALGGLTGAVNAIAIQPNGQAVIGGNFFSYNTAPVYSVARLLTNGFLDASFNNVQQPGVNYGGAVSAIVIDASGRIIIGGSFSSYDGTNAENIARLNYNGSLDTTFNSGIGFNSFVTALAIDANSNILVGGDFTSYNTTNCNHVARLLPGGGLDPTFLPNTGNGHTNYGTDQDVEAVATDGNGNIILGGDFSYVNGSNISYVARLLPSGAVDTSFNPEIGPDDTVYSVAVETANNNEILIGGAFQNYNLVSRNGVALIANNGSLDTTFVPGSGADEIVYSVSLQPANGDVLVGGQFKNFSTIRRLGVARLLPNGWVDTSFMDTAYNQFAGLINKAYSDPVNAAYVLALQPDGNILVGGSFTNVGGGAARDAVHSQVNITRILGASTAGPQTGGGGIGNCPGNITLTQNPYTVDDTSGKLFVTVQRTNGSLGSAQVTLGTNTLAPGPGDATATDFGLIFPATSLYNEIYNVWGNILPYGSYGWRQSDGFYGYNNAIQPIADLDNTSLLNLNIYNDTAAQQNLFADLSLLNINAQGLLVLGGVPVPTFPALGLPGAGLEIVNNNFPPGVLGFSATNYTANDTSNNVAITVLRTNGSFGRVSVEYYTSDGSAYNGVNYTGSPSPSSRTELTFNGGTASNSATFNIPITLQSTAQSTTKFYVSLTGASYSGAFNTNFLPTNTTVTIIDGNFLPGHLSFTSPSYTVSKGGLATVGVMRSGGAVGVLTVQCGTSDGTNINGHNAINGTNYTGVTNTLTWSNQDVSVKTMTFQTLQDNTVDGNLTNNVFLFNATNVGSTNNDGLILLAPTNATVAILESDSYGNLGFAVPNFNIMQNAGQALITVVRTGGATGTISASFTTANDITAVLPYYPALAGTNYGSNSGVLTFGEGVTSQSFVVPIYNTSSSETTGTNRIVNLVLSGESPSNAASSQFPPLPITNTLTILDPLLILNPAGAVDVTTLNGTGFNGLVDSLALQPDGSVLAGGAFTFFNQYPFEYVARLQPNAAYDSSFLFDQAGANSNVLQVLSQTTNSIQTNNGPVMIVGEFNQVDEVTRGGIARLNLDGSLDETFNPGSGADTTIYALAETFPYPGITNNSPLAYYIGGSFANFDGVPSGGITRLNGSTNSPGAQGTVDPNFNPGQGLTGSNAIIRALAVQANLQVIAGGDFNSFNGVTHNHLVRLNVDGSVDTSFNPSTGSDPTGSIRAIAIQADGRILIGGLFTNVNGSNYNYLARLNTDGSLDTNFNVGVGGNNSVLALAVDSQERILVGGEFTRFSGVTRSGITRLNPDGTVDPTINFQSGADGGFVDTIAIESDDEIDVGGGFSTFEGIAENNYVRLYGGANAGDGSIQFFQAVYGVLEDGTNATITIQRLGGEGTSNQPNASITFSTSDGTASNGIDYTAVRTNLIFPLGETFETVTIPILINNVVASNRFLNLNLSSPIYAGIGVQASAILIITNVNEAVNFSAQVYNQSANAPGSNAIIPVVRIGNPNNTVAITVYTGTNGTATPNVDYTPTTNVLIFNPGVMTNDFLVPLLNATNMFSDQTVDLEMSNPSNTIIGSPSSATLYIDSVYNGPGVLAFSQTNYAVSEGATNAVITVVRTNGSFGQVSVMLTTSNGTAVAGINYSNVQTTLNFSSGEVSQSISIPVIQQTNASPDLTVLLTLSNPQGTTIGGAAQEILTIQNDIDYFSFASSFTFVDEDANAVLQVVCGGPATNPVPVMNYYTYSPPGAAESNGLAVPGVDYIPITNGTLSFATNQTQTFPVTIIQGNTLYTNGPLTFQVILSNATPADGVQIVSPGTNTVSIISDVTGFEFSATNYTVGENGGNIVITVTRLNPNTGEASVQFTNINGTAVGGTDYVPTNGTLTFLNGQASNNFTVSILNPNMVENNKTFSVILTNPLVLTLPNPSTNAYLVSPSNATVTITNVLAGLGFGSPAYTVSKCGGQPAVISVALTGVTNNPVSVFYSTTNGGSATAGVNYVFTSGELNFAPGVTNQTFDVSVINDNVDGPNQTVYLVLYGEQGAQLLTNTAVLTIEECLPVIVASGTAFVSGTASPPGAILSNETVTVLLGLRNIAGSNTVGLTATLLSANGVVATNIDTNVAYGNLIASGPTVARPFTFTAVGTNGQNITASLALHDTADNTYPNVSFGFTVGGSSTTFSTNETLFLTGSNNPPSKAYNSNPPNYGYPSEINVSGVVGTMTAVTVTLSNFYHTYPSDVAAVLESPTGQDTYLIADCGGDIEVSNINLTFSQSVTNLLPESTAITSGTYLPTAYAAPPLPATLVSQPQVPANTPYPTSLASFVGQSPNGTWLLFVADEEQFDSGYISNGWSLNISTAISVGEDSDLEMVMTPSPTDATMGNPLTYIISVTNYGPAAATNVIITDTLPLGVYYSNNLVTNTVMVTNLAGTLPVSNGVTFTVTVTPNTNALGVGYYITNIAVATANQPDPNSNNVQTNVLLVGLTSADLGVTVTNSTNSVMNGANVTYTIVVTNNGPSTAANVIVTNVLPANFILITNQFAQGATNGASGATNTPIIWDVGTVSNASSVTMTTVAQADLPGNSLPSLTNFESVSVGSPVYDPIKVNNFAFVNTAVVPPIIAVTGGSGTNYTLTWPAGFVLEGSVQLPPTWVIITNVTSPYMLPGTGGYHYFRVVMPMP